MCKRSFATRPFQSALGHHVALNLVALVWCSH